MLIGGRARRVVTTAGKTIAMDDNPAAGDFSQPFTDERLRLVLDSARIGMWDWHPQTGEVLFDENCAMLLGLSTKDISMSMDEWVNRVHPEDLKQCLNDVKAHLDGKTEFYENLHRMRHADGRWVFILDRGRVTQYDSEGKPVRFTGTHSDLTPLKQAEFKALQAMKDRDRFFSSMSHELRAPVHAILGIVELVEQQLDDPELKEQLSIVQDSGQHLLLIIRDLLDTAQFADASIELQPSLFDAVDVIHYVVKLYSIRARQKGLLLKTDIRLEDGSLCLELDRNRLMQILINLVSNAIKYTEEGAVTLVLFETNEHIVFRVKDTGMGIEHVERIFDAYSQEKNSRFDDVNSTGLGLYICKTVADLMSLKISVTSEVGRGSTFDINIPHSLKRESAATQAFSEPEHRANPRNWPEKRVLIVDDTPVNLLLLKGMLRGSPLKIDCVNNGEEALEYLHKQDVDIVLTDLHMPKMGGLRLTYAIRHEYTGRQPVIIGQSADAVDDVRDRCLQVGMNYYLAKPFSRNRLLSVLDDFIKV